MSEGRSEDFQNIFHSFFNPARYLKLFEIIPGPQTSTEVLDFLLYMREILGKLLVAKILQLIGNRIGILTKFVPFG
jgi:3-hydroxyacyl-CoA dehydrogenase